LFNIACVCAFVNQHACPVQTQALQVITSNVPLCEKLTTEIKSLEKITTK